MAKITMLGKTLTGRYKIVKQLGGGGFSHTFIAEDGHLPDHPLCVIKQLKPVSSQAEVLRISRELFDKEAKILYRLGKHDCIPSLLAHFEEDQEFFLAQELIEGNVLSQEIKSGQCWGEGYTIDFLTDILSTLDFVHQQQVIHRDIKPSNLIRRDRDRKIVLIDFGAVKEVSTQSINQSFINQSFSQSFNQSGNTSSLVIGSPGYMPNEQYSGKTIFASDIYAIGIIAIQALTGLSPNQIPEDLLTSEFCWRDRVEVTPTLADVIDKMVRFDFRQRYQSIDELLEAIQPLRARSLAQTILSEITPPPLVEKLPIPPETPQSLIEEISDDLEMSADPIRAKKLVCLVCTGILENDLKRLDNFSFVELLEDIYQQYPTIESLKENLVKSVKTIAVHKQRQYLIVAKIIFNAASKLYQQSIVPAISKTMQSSASDSSSQPVIPQISYNVSHLVINAGSAQLVAPFDTSHVSTSHNQSNFTEEERSLIDESFIDESPVDDLYLNEEPDIYALAIHDIDIDAQQIRLKKLLLYAYQDVWENDLSQLNSVDWLSLLRELISFMPTFPQLIALIQEAVQRVSKPAEYVVIGNLLLTKLERLYPDRLDPDSFSAIAPVINQPNNQSYQSYQSDRKIPFDPKIADDLFDLRLELMRFTNSMRTKILLFSVLYYPFDPDRDNWHDLRTHRLDGLLHQLFYTYPSFIKAEKSIWKTARSLNEPTAYTQSANYILQAIKVLYDQLDARSMEHPADGSDQGGECTQPSAIAFSQDDDSCQFG